MAEGYVIRPRPGWYVSISGNHTPYLEYAKVYPTAVAAACDRAGLAEVVSVEECECEEREVPRG